MPRAANAARQALVERRPAAVSAEDHRHQVLRRARRAGGTSTSGRSSDCPAGGRRRLPPRRGQAAVGLDELRLPVPGHGEAVADLRQPDQARGRDLGREGPGRRRHRTPGRCRPGTRTRARPASGRPRGRSRRPSRRGRLCERASAAEGLVDLEVRAEAEADRPRERLGRGRGEGGVDERRARGVADEDGREVGGKLLSELDGPRQLLEVARGIGAARGGGLEVPDERPDVDAHDERAEPAQPLAPWERRPGSSRRRRRRTARPTPAVPPGRRPRPGPRRRR